MSIIKPRSAKAAKLPEATSESKAQALTEAILAEKTTELSKAIDDAVLDSMVYGTGSVKVVTNQLTGQLTGGPFVINTGSGHSVRHSSSNPGWPRPVDLKKEMLETHPVFELTVEQLRAAWMLTYGSRWMDMSEIYADDYMDKVATRLKALGELEVHGVIDQYSPMARIKI